MQKKDYCQSQYARPYCRDRGEARKQKIRKILKYSALVILVLIIAAGVYFFFFSAYFMVSEETLAWQSLNKLEIDAAGQYNFYLYLKKSPRRFWLVSPLNLNFIDEKKTSGYLAMVYNLKTIKLEKKYPNFILIVYEIKLPAFVWQEAEKNYLIDETGSVAREINLLNLEQELPFISRTTSTAVIIGASVIKKSTLFFIQELLDKLKRLNLNWRVNKTEFINNQVPTIILITNEGWRINFSQSLEIDSQLIKMLRILNAPDFNRQKVEYIDLQVSNKVYYK